MPVIYIELASNDGGLTPDPKYNVFYADSLGTGLLSEDLHDETLTPTGISLSEGAAPFTDSGRSASNADSSPDARLDVEFFRGHFFKGGNGEKFVLGNFPPGHPYTLEPAGQTGSGRETVFSATNSSPESATYTPDSTDPKDAPQPPVMTGTADASGFIAVGADFVTLYPYMNGFILSYEAFTAPTITDINTNNEVIPDTTATLTGTNLTGATGFNIGSEAQSDFTVVSDTSITFTTVRGGNPYNQNLTGTLLHPDGNQTITVQQVPESGTFAVTAASPNTTDDASLWTGLIDTVTGDPVTVVDGYQALVKNPNNIPNLAIAPDGTITADETGTFVVELKSNSEQVWGGEQTVIFEVAVTGSAPTIELPYTTATIAVGDSWTNPTATANDAEDGDISNSISVSGSVDVNTEGDYALTYSVTDSDNNTTTADLVVSVVAGADGTISISNIENNSSGFVVTYSYTGIDTVTIEYSVNGKSWQTATGGTITYTGIQQGRVYRLKTRINKSGLITYVDDLKLFTLKSGDSALSLSKVDAEKISNVVEDLSTGTSNKTIKGSIFNV